MCRRVAAKVQQMQQLPSSRVKPSPTFSITGMDFAGPFLTNKGHTRKPVIIKVFICFVSKSTYLEVVSELTTVAFVT